MKRSLATSLLLALVLGALPSCSKVLYAPQYQTGTIAHVVVCYLKKPGDAADRKRVIDATRTLRSIPGVYDIEVGEPLAGSTRPVVVKDYDVAIVAFFRDQKALEAYETHPKHQKAVQEVLLPLTQKLVVYDFVTQE